ncbi:FAD-dependent monooxygenase [Nocardia sp. NPDC049190]|uniref:FAD-dependent monooxygenase n=1 Tax=Nocardia sp. NPDC049190 TaxID=3155650 RepID=UPI0033F94A28
MGTSTMSTPRILVTGGGIAGNTVALQLLRAGYQITVVERAAAPRPGGQAVDLRGPSREAADRMGLLPGIGKLQLDGRGMAHVNAKGRDVVRMPTEMFDGKGFVSDIEITRGDLNQVLLDAIADTDVQPDYRYGVWVTEVQQDDDGVEVTFASGHVERFDLVIGADGVHSGMRRLVFGPERDYATHLGGYMAFFTIPAPENIEPGWLKVHSVPGANCGIRPDRDPSTVKAIVMLRNEIDPALRGDAEAQKQTIRRKLADGGWVTPYVLEHMATTPDFYFDQLARIDMPTLSSGRVTLLGDAGFCGSPLTGMGTAMAIVGAYLLAGEVTTTPGDIPGALARYEERVTPFLAEAKELPGSGTIATIVPGSRFTLGIGRVVTRAMASRAMRPVMMRILSRTDDFELPVY